MKYRDYRITALATTHLWLYPSELSANEKVVLHALIFLCETEDNELSYETLSKYLKMSSTVLKGIVSKLRAKKIIRTIRKMLGISYIFMWNKSPIFGKVSDENLFFRQLRIDGTRSDYLFNNVDYYYILFNNRITNNQNLSSIDLLLNSKRLRLRRRNENSQWYDALIKPKEPLPKKEAPMRIPAEIKAITEYWKFCQLKLPKETTKAYRKDLLAIKRLFNGKMFGTPYTSEQLKQAITDFSGAALDPDYEPSDPNVKKKMAKTSISAFIRNPFAKNYSHFLRYLAEPPKRIIPLLENKDPAITEHFKKFYFQKILKKPYTRLTNTDENKFRKATSRFLELIRSSEVSNRLRYSGMTKIDVADLLCRCIVERANGRTITPGWFSNDLTFEDSFPKYLKDRALMESAQNVDFRPGSYEESDF